MAWFITENNEKLYISDKISGTLISPLKERMNSHTFPFKIPVHIDSDKFFERASNINAKNNKVRQITGWMVLNNIVRFYGVLTSKSINSNFYDCSFTGQCANWSKMKKMLSELELGEIDISARSAINYEIVPDGQYGYYNLYHALEKYYYENGDIVISFPPYYNFNKTNSYNFEITNDSKILINGRSLDDTPGFHQQFDCPLLQVKFILKRIFNSLGFNVSFNEFDKGLLSNIFLLSNYSTSYIQFTEIDTIYDIPIDSIKNENSQLWIYCTSSNQTDFDKIMFGAEGLGYVKLYDLTINKKNDFEGRIFHVTEFDRDIKKFAIDIGDSSIEDATICGKIKGMIIKMLQNTTCKIHEHLPYLYLSDFIEILQNAFNIVLIPSESKMEVKIRSYKDILLAKEYIDITEISNDVTELTMNELKGITISYTGDPDDYYSKFVDEIPSDYNKKDAVDSLSLLPMTGNIDKDIRLVRDRSEYYVWDTINYGSRQSNNTTYLFLGNWSFYCKNYVSKTIGEGDGLKIEINATPIINCADFSEIPAVEDSDWNWFDVLIGRRKQTLPRIDMACNASFIKDKTNIGVKFCFLNGENKIDGFGLHIDGEDSIYENCYKHYAEWRLNRYKEGRCVINWNDKDITNFAWDKKRKIKDTQYLVFEIPFEQEGNKPIVYGDSLLVRV